MLDDISVKTMIHQQKGFHFVMFKRIFRMKRLRIWKFDFQIYMAQMGCVAVVHKIHMFKYWHSGIQCMMTLSGLKLEYSGRYRPMSWLLVRWQCKQWSQQPWYWLFATNVLHYLDIYYLVYKLTPLLMVKWWWDSTDSWLRRRGDISSSQSLMIQFINTCKQHWGPLSLTWFKCYPIA